MAFFVLFALEPSRQGREAVVLKALSGDPHPAIFVGGLYGREALLLTGEGRLRAALPYWRQAAALDPLSSWESTGLATTLAALGQFPESMTLFDRCLKLWPNEIDIRAQYLAVLEFYGAPKQALAAIGDPAIAHPISTRRRSMRRARSSQPAATRPASPRHGQRGRFDWPPPPAHWPPTPQCRCWPSLAIPRPPSRSSPTQPIGSMTRSFVFIPAAAKLRADPQFMALSARLGHVDYWQSTGKWPDFCTEERLPDDCKTEAARAAAVR